MLVIVLLLASQLSSRLRAHNSCATQCTTYLDTLNVCSFDDASESTLPAPAAPTPCSCSTAMREAENSRRRARCPDQPSLPRPCKSEGQGRETQTDARAGGRHATTTPSAPVSLPRAMTPSPSIADVWALAGPRVDDVTASHLSVNFTTQREITAYAVMALERLWADYALSM